MSRKRLIEFGWDEPDPAFMRAQVAQMRATPFDGCVFHLTAEGGANFTWHCWSREAFPEEAFAAALEDLQAAYAAGGFQDNFLRFNVTPGDVDWFEDFGAILHNAELAARIAREGRCRGLLFDIEQYNHPVFHYSKLAEATGRSWEDYAAQVRRRGAEVMEAFQRGYPGLEVFLTFGYSLPWHQSQSGARPLETVSYGLLAPFLDGMVEAAQGGTTLIDGHELSYGYREPEAFEAAARRMREELLPIVAQPERYREVFRISFGLWLDCRWREVGWHIDDLSKNYHQPEQFGACLRRALELCDDYVWVYSETPRWWSPEGPIKLPEAYVQAIRRAVAPFR
ncbi:MAG: hypothetical protein KatS3mg115_1111 [Candidatus Poribacteria bacterium]|nr:MAG: hypothetical protein KatS3mg115_1111 [Candidatus Poribacteria bacterium]